MELINIIRNQDIFGTPIQLNFNKKGSSHKILLGGLFTLIGKTLIFLYAISLFVDMFRFANDTTSVEG